jgi:CRISPR-associated protein Cmr4
MYTEARLIGLYAETPLHPGSGSTTGVIDLPVQRERHTGHPLIPGPTLKGVIRDLAGRGEGTARVAEYFGTEPGETDPEEKRQGGKEQKPHAGALSLTDARLLAFPVRSLQGVFVWITCPLVLDRLRRDCLLGNGPAVPAVAPVPRPGEAVRGTADTLGTGPLVLEEFDYTWIDQDEARSEMNQVGDLVAGFLPDTAAHRPYQDRLKTHLVLLSDNDFQYFVMSATEIATRIRLNERKTTTGGVGNMWVEETLPADCIFYAVALASPPRTGDGNGSAPEVMGFLERALTGGLLQIGAGETVGHGWMRVRIASPAEGKR